MDTTDRYDTLAYWLGVRLAYEKSAAGRYRRMNEHFARFSVALGKLLLPSVRATAEAFREWARAVVEAEERIHS